LIGSSDLPAGANGFDAAALAGVLRNWDAPDVVGHRVVHGGTSFTGPVVIDADVRQQLEDLTALAPLHQPKSLAALDAVCALLPDVPAVGCFDTAFHATIPDDAATYAIPRAWRERYGVRRYGFHGLSHAYAARRAAELLDRPVDELRIVTCHLGAGASLAAVRAGRSVDTTMGFTPLEGLVMATRSGTVDPGLVLWLIQSAGLAPGDVSAALERESGLIALAGTGDMRAVEAAAAAGNAEAVLAIDVYIHRLVGAVGAMTSATQGLDALVFTGGVGENSAQVRRLAAQRLGYLGVALDTARNDDVHGIDSDLTRTGAPVRTLVVAAREDLQIAQEARSAVH
ncbi:MAG: acetate kinase, partial [Frankiaceae bacterium]|nr:acetate kinase [Frankiaceae bacterium]